MFKRIKHKMAVRRFTKRDLGIIEDIPEGLIPQIIEHHRSLGWEMSGSFNQFNWSKNWYVKLRKGTCVLEVKWNPRYLGSMVGLKYILKEVAEQFELSLRNAPTLR